MEDKSDQTVKFVQLIENYQCLYNHTLAEHSRKDVTEKAWSAIGQKMKWTAADCKDKWKNIRNGFVRSLKPPASGSSAKSKKPYYLHDIMQFVLPYVRPIQHLEKTGNISLEESEIVTETDEDNPEPQLSYTLLEENKNDNVTKCSEESSFNFEKKKRKRRHAEEKDEIDHAILDYIKEKKSNKTLDDDRRMFLLSLLPDIKNLSDKNMRQFKIKTLVLLEQLLTQQEKSIDHFQIHDNAQSYHAPSPISIPSSSASSIYDTTDGYTIHNLESLPACSSNINDQNNFL
ncbi:uncharacterized protein [Onthophagus taurus]|uniref:uncharacterized protein n=1 Tax=Onthophagus taurus TaxID=166361 RepID=UPI0039BE0972